MKKTSLDMIPSHKVLISKIDFDKNNPNIFEEIKKQGLEKVVKKWGFAVDPWLNKKKNGRYLVIDGEHRIKLLQEKGIKKVKCKVFDIPYSEVRMLRQIANKLRGQHDKKKDAAEFYQIFKDNNLDVFSQYLGSNYVEFEKIIKQEYNFESDSVQSIDEIDLKTKCPKCGYEW